MGGPDLFDDVESEPATVVVGRVAVVEDGLALGVRDAGAVVEQLLRVATYDDRARERFALAERRAALEAEKTSVELQDSEEYARLTRRIEELGEAADEAFEGMALDEFAHTFGDADADEE